MLSIKERAAQIMEHLCSCYSHGYSQYSRLGDGGRETIALSDGSTVEIATGDRDCSSAVIDAYRSAGADVGGATYTGNMRSCMCGTGQFEWYPMSSGYIAQRGDVYLNEVNHTAMCTSAVPDMLAEFSISETGSIDGAEGDQTGWESHIQGYYDYPWDGILVYVGPDSGGVQTPSEPQKPADMGKIPVHYALRVTGGSWWPTVTDFRDGDDGYAGAPNTEHDMLCAWADRGVLRYRAHTREDGWLPWVRKGDMADLENGCAGVTGHSIDGVQFYYETPSGEQYRQAYYRSQTTERVGWLPVCSDDGTNNDGLDSWAGIYGEPLDRLQLCVATGNPF